VIDIKHLMDESDYNVVHYVPEHSLFWMRILLPFLGRGTEQLVDRSGMLKLSIKDTNYGYDVIKAAIKVQC
jgi:hypothetical protein